MFLFVIVLVIFVKEKENILADDIDQKNRSENPNIIYILADDAGYGDLSSYGQEKFETPNIDRLAEEGMKFSQHYAGSTVCAPSRSTLITGQHTGNTYVRGNRGNPDAAGDLPLPHEKITLLDLLNEAEYVSAAYGKWGLGYHGTVGDPLRHGFDDFFGYYGQGHAHNHYPDHVYHNGEKIELNGEIHTQTLIMDYALDFIKNNQDQAFFLYLPLLIPHAAMQAPEDYMAAYREKWPQFEDKTAQYGGVTINNPIAGFAAMMTMLDDDVGRILDLLEELGIDDNTIVMFTSDNGPHHEGGHDPDFFNSYGPLRGYKRDLYEGGIRVPKLVRWPDKIEAGSLTDHPSAFWDLMPTIADIINVKAPHDIDGISYLPVLLGNEDQQESHDYLYWEFFERGGRRAVLLDGIWKGIQLHVNDDPEGHIYLYNLENDLAEENDISHYHPEIVAEIKSIFEEARTESNYFRFDWEPLFIDYINDKPEGDKLDQRNWGIVEVSSESVFNDRIALKAIDGQNNTNWHTAWRNQDPVPEHPHHLIIDLGANYQVDGIAYLPRQDNNLNGTLVEFKIYSSLNNIDYEKVKLVDNLPLDPNKKVISFPSIETRYLKIKTIKSNGPWASAAGIYFYGK
ncbi:sulfatase-like hydrolase/transferase [Natronospora cellulosivora (SeqCode)]